MKINSQAQLVFEMKKVRQALEAKDIMSLERFHANYTKLLGTPKKDIIREGHLTLCSAESSYHLLAMYTLLDVIDYFWDGYRFYEKKMGSGFSLLNELSVSMPAKPLEFQKFHSFLNKPSQLKLSEPLYVFILPFMGSRDYVIKRSIPGNILVLYTNSTESFRIENAFYEGLADFYLKDTLKQNLPHWARSEAMFAEEFIHWCKKGNSMFRG